MSQWSFRDAATPGCRHLQWSGRSCIFFLKRNASLMCPFIPVPLDFQPRSWMVHTLPQKKDNCRKVAFLLGKSVLKQEHKDFYTLVVNNNIAFLFADALYVVFEPTCSYCMVGLYAPLSVRLSVRLSLDNNSYLGKYYSYESETLPQYKAFIGAYRKNTNYTLGSILLIDE